MPGRVCMQVQDTKQMLSLQKHRHRALTKAIRLMCNPLMTQHSRLLRLLRLTKLNHLIWRLVPISQVLRRQYPGPRFSVTPQPEHMPFHLSYRRNSVGSSAYHPSTPSSVPFSR
jgi:hypothetical protein